MHACVHLAVLKTSAGSACKRLNSCRTDVECAACCAAARKTLQGMAMHKTLQGMVEDAHLTSVLRAATHAKPLGKLNRTCGKPRTGCYCLCAALHCIQAAAASAKREHSHHQRNG